MRVTPTTKKFGKYMPGEEFDFPDTPAKVFVKLGKLRAVEASAPTYETRMMQAAPAAVPVTSGYSRLETDLDPLPGVLTTTDAPFGYKADGTPRKRPGRKAAE